MKPKNLLFPLFVSVILTLASCTKKDEFLTPIDTNGSVNADSSYLSMMYYIEKSGSVSDTVATVVYTYDVNKRLTKIKDSAWVPAGDYRTETSVYFYKDSDTVPYKSTVTTIWDNSQPDFVSTTYFFFNASGLRLKDSLIEPGRHYVAQQQFQTGKIISSRLDSIFIPSNTFSYSELRKDTAIVDANGNVTSCVSHRGANNIYRSTVTYDNKLSPFAKLSNAKVLALFPTGETMIWEMPKKNNRLKILETRTQTNQPTETYYEDDLTGKYIYRADGYPVQVSETDISSGITSIITFKYKAL